jgi:hypothetical protein
MAAGCLLALLLFSLRPPMTWRESPPSVTDERRERETSEAPKYLNARTWPVGDAVRLAPSLFLLSVP